MLISACGRIVRVGFEWDTVAGVVEERRSGHSIIDFDRVLRRMGR